MYRITLEAVRGDITKNNGVEAIVNAAKTNLLGGGGVDGAIHKAAGMGLFFECVKLHGCKTGQAKITGAYKLPCKYIIHTPGPIWKDGNSNECELLASCYKSCLQIAVEKGISSIAFPSISTGIYHFPLYKASEIAVKTVMEFLSFNPGSINIVKWILFDDETLNAYKSEIDRRII